MSDLNIEKDNDMDIKALFEKDFEADDIFVSEDLISRTMASIRALENDTSDAAPEASAKTTEPENTSKVTSISNRRKFLRITYGIAAALVIGIIGFSIYRFGGTLKQSDKSNADSYMNTASSKTEGSDNADYAGAVKEADATVENKYEASESAPMDDEPENDENIKLDADGAVMDTIESTALRQSENYPEVDIDMSNFSYGIDHEKQAIKQADTGSVPEEKEVPDDETDDDNYTPQVSQMNIDPEQVLDSIFSEYDSLYTADDTKDNSAIDTGLLKQCSSYQLLIQGLRSLEDPLTPVISLLEQSTDSARGEYVLAVILEDISGVSFNDENGKPLWTSGKEYLALYKAQTDID
jgi:hypothetical protein